MPRSKKHYEPSPEILTNYARVLIDFALGSGKGVQPGEVVYLQFDILAMPLALEVSKRILEKGGHPLIKIHEESFQKLHIDHSSDDQLSFFPKKYMRELVNTIDHRMYLIAPRNPFLLKNSDPRKMMLANKSTSIMKKWLFDKEDQGKMTWTLALYGTDGMAREAGLSLQDFWAQIEKACFLNETDPLKTWERVFVDLEKLRLKLSSMPIEKLNLQSKETDLWITIGEQRQWLSGSGRNIPSFEMFTSPDWRGTEGHIYFDYPLYRYGNIIKDIRLEFKKGKVVKAQALKNEKLLIELIKQRNADKIGEYSLTDIRYSHIDAFMANTLFDENYGGKFGNTHLAVGSSYHEGFAGDVRSLKNADFKRLGFNESPEHTDIIATHDRVVTAHMRDGSTKVIYAKGQFKV